MAESSVIGIMCCFLTLHTLDLTAPEAAPIVKMLEKIPSTLRFVLVRASHCTLPRSAQSLTIHMITGQRSLTR